MHYRWQVTHLQAGCGATYSHSDEADKIGFWNWTDETLSRGVYGVHGDTPPHPEKYNMNTLTRGL